MKAAIEHVAWALPPRTVSNSELRALHPDWDFERLIQRTGVISRHMASDGETALDLAVQACETLDQQGKLLPQDIDVVIFCTLSPDHIVPSNSCLLHGKLGLKRTVLAFDINVGCAGYLNGLQVSSSLIQSGAAKRVLLVTADTYTRRVHPGDRATYCLFGDGAAASIIATSQNGGCVRDVRSGTAGSHYKTVMIPAGGMRLPCTPETARESIDHHGNVRTPEHTWMDGMGVLAFFNSTVPAAVREIVNGNGLSMDDIHLFVFHQASQVALDGIRASLRIPPDRMLCDIGEIGNLVSASIPVALGRALASGRAKRGQLTLLCGFGSGLSWGTALVDL